MFNIEEVFEEDDVVNRFTQEEEDEINKEKKTRSVFHKRIYFH